MEMKPYIFYAITTLVVFMNVNGIPLKKNSAGRENADQNDLMENEKQSEDENVRELKSLKSSGDASLSSLNSKKVSYVNVNGVAEHAEVQEQIHKNGELVERIHQKIDSKQKSESATPDTHVITEVEIPSKGIHKWLEQDSARDIQKKTVHSKPKYSYADNAIANNLLEIFKMKNIIRYLPIEMAEYIYRTGDEKTVTMAIENYLQLGILDRDEAIAYLQEIKAILNTMEEEDQRDKKQEQRRYMENLYGKSRNKMDMNQALSDLKDIQQLIQTKFLKRSYIDDNTENLNIRYGYVTDENDNPEPYIEDIAPYRSSEKDYKHLAEKLQNFEDLFSESSMEGVIYQLSKVLFYQSLSMNGFEAQESLKQFTNFLETQVDEGHISRAMERKVLDILLAALANTLSEHPELINGKQFKENISGSSSFKAVEKKNGDANKKRHSKMNFKGSGILDGDQKH